MSTKKLYRQQQAERDAARRAGGPMAAVRRNAIWVFGTLAGALSLWLILGLLR
jgi:hypothetical protein